MVLPRGDYLILSCEHGGNRVPPRFRKRFSKKLLGTHRGDDPGALALARALAAATGAPLFYSTVSRLLVELNRPLGHPRVFYLPLSEKARGVRRTTDVGLLFDPARPAFSPAWSTRFGKSLAAGATSASRSRSTRNSRAGADASGEPYERFL